MLPDASQNKNRLVNKPTTLVILNYYIVMLTILGFNCSVASIFFLSPPVLYSRAGCGPIHSPSAPEKFENAVFFTITPTDHTSATETELFEKVLQTWAEFENEGFKLGD